MRASFVLALAAAQPLEVKLGWVLPELKITSTWVAPRINAACGALAVRAVNARDGNVSPTLAALRHNFTLTIAETIEYGGDADAWAPAISQLADSVDVLIMDTSSTYSVAVADAVNMRTKPAMMLMAQSPDFNYLPEKQWFRYYRLLPSSSVALQQLVQFAQDAGWTHLAVIYPPDDDWGKALVNELSVENFKLTLLPVSFEEDKEADKQMAAELRNSGCRVVVCFVWTRMEGIVSLLKSEGLLTHDWAFLGMDELEYLEIPGVFFGSLARDFQPGPLAQLQDEWATTMPTFVGMPISVPVLATERKELTSSMMGTSCYDSVVAVAVAVDNLLDSVGGNPSAVTD